MLGVSVDSRYSQGRFSEALGLVDTVLLADFHPKGGVSSSYGVYRDDLGFSGRASFVIDKAGIVRGVSLTGAPSGIPDEEDYFEALAVCEVSAGGRDEAAASWPHAAATSAPRERRTDASRPASARVRRKISRRP